MRLLVCGSRTWKDAESILRAIDGLSPAPTLLIHGGARGADQLAAKAATKRGIPIRCFMADWEQYGRSAGRIRNLEMLELGRPDRVIAFWDGSSRGTAHMIHLAQVAGLPVDVITKTK